MQTDERHIIQRVIGDALKAGFTLDVNDGEETVLKNSSDPVAILGAMASTDEDFLIFRKNGRRFGWVYLVYGNDGWDVICDHSTNLEDVLSEATAMADRIANLGSP